MTGLSEEEMLACFDRLSNWGRWGTTSPLGTLNFVTPAKRLTVLGGVTEGITVSCAWDIDPADPADAVPAPIRHVTKSGQGLRDEHRLHSPGWSSSERSATTAEFIGTEHHGIRLTHIDALSHVFWDGRMFGGEPSELVSSEFGATVNDVTSAREGIVTRGILVDVAAHRDVPWLQPGEGVFPEEIEAILEKAGLVAESGDALFLRTGYGRWRGEQGPHGDIRQRGRAGWHGSCLPYFAEHEISVIGADTAQDVSPSGYDTIRSPVHSVGISRMGLWLIDNCELESLAETCARLGRWDFALFVGSLPLVGATGSLVNPIALF